MVLIKATLLLLGALSLGMLLRRGSAALRAALYGAVVLGLLLFPLLSVITPPVPVIPLTLPAPSAPDLMVPSGKSAVATSLPAVKPMTSVVTGSLAPAPVAPFPWERVVFGVLGLGSIISLARVGIGLLGLRQFVRESTPAAEPLPAEMAHLAAALHLRRLPDVRIASSTLALSSPLTFGWWRGTILLPESSLTQSAGLRGALLHELVHLQRQDWLLLICDRLTVALWWFHPLVHMLVRRLRLEIEAACDDRVLRFGVSAPDYAGYLVSFARLATGERP